MLILYYFFAKTSCATCLYMQFIFALSLAMNCIYIIGMMYVCKKTSCLRCASNLVLIFVADKACNEMDKAATSLGW